MSMRTRSQVHWPTIFLSLLILSAAGAIQMGCSDQLIGLDESALATQQANENIAVQVARYSEDSGHAIDDPTIATRPFEVIDSLPNITPPIVHPKDSLNGGKGGVSDTMPRHRKGLEDEMNLTLTFRGADTVRIDATGGTVLLSGLSGMGKMYFPEDALKKTEDITVTTCNSFSEDLLVYEFKCGPDGTRFERAVVLELSSSLFVSTYGKLPTDGVWMYLDEHTHTWSVLREVKVGSDGNFRIPIEHFSTYRMVVTPAVALSQGGQN